MNRKPPAGGAFVQGVDVPRLITGGLAEDDRGVIQFTNDFDLGAGIRRYYVVTNHRVGFVRAWHAHRHEAKYITVVQGSALVGVVAVDNWETPSRDLEIHRYVMSCRKPSVLYVPAGHANGFMSLTQDATLVFFSTKTVEESTDDDIRYDARYWDPWHIAER